jgi:hypothetical protein
MIGKNLYIIQTDVTGALKIGRSNNAQKRLKELQVGSHTKLKLLCEISNMGHVEKRIHQRLSQFKIRKRGEWFYFDCAGNLPNWLCEAIDWDVANIWWEK